MGAKDPVLSAEASATPRDQLLAELEGLGLKDDLDAWALRTWPKVNTLVPADGDKVREAFQARFTRLQSASMQDLPPAEANPLTPNDETRSPIDKSVLAMPEPKWIRDKQHLRFVAKQQPGGREPSDPSSLCAAARARTKGQRRITVPLCREHHRELHRAGKERDWWSRNGLENYDFKTSHH